MTAILSIAPVKLTPMDDGLSFGEWLEREYRRAGYDQSSFAEAIHYKQPSVSGWVTGRRRLRSQRACIAIADVLELDPDEVFRRAEVERRGDVTNEQSFTDPALQSLYDRMPPEDQRIIRELMKRAAERESKE